MVDAAEATPHSTFSSKRKLLLQPPQELMDAKKRMQQASSPAVRKKARKRWRQLQRKHSFQVAIAKKIPPMLQINQFENSKVRGAWPEKLHQKCSSKFDLGAQHENHLHRAQEVLWKEAGCGNIDDEEVHWGFLGTNDNENEKDAAHWGFLGTSSIALITIAILLQARARMKAGKVGGVDFIVAEIIRAIPPMMCYPIINLFNAKLRGVNLRPEKWSTIIMAWLKKECNPKKFKELRGVTVLSVFSKWFMQCCMLLGELKSAEVPRPRGWNCVASFGFMKTKEVADVACSLLTLFSQSFEWRERCPLHVFEGDILSAFDYMNHDLCVAAMKFNNWPGNVIAAVHSQNTGMMVETSFVGMEVPSFNLNRCFTQGSVEGPQMWKLIIYFLLSNLVPLWQESGWGFTLNDYVSASGEFCSSPRKITHLVWADNIWILADTFPMMEAMVCSLTRYINYYGLVWKEKSLKTMSTRIGGTTDLQLATLDENLEPTEMMILAVNELKVLGTKIDEKGDTASAYLYRLEMAEIAFKANHHIICCKGAGLRARFAEYVKRVVPVLLHGSGGWAWSEALRLKIRGFEGRCVTRIVGSHTNKEGDEFMEWWKQRTAVARGLFEKLGFVIIEERVLAKIFKHSYKIKAASKHDVDTLCGAALTWKSNHWCNSHPNASRHIAGRPKARWADVFVKFAGEKWFSQPCSDLESWKSRLNDFISISLAKKKKTDNYELKAFDELRPKIPRDISGYNVHVNWEPLNVGAHAIELCGDSMLVVQWLNGEWPCFKDVFRKPMAEGQCSFHKWAISGARPRKRHLSWCRHLPRELNSVADGLATKGKNLENCEIVVEKFDRPEFGEQVFLRGFWDGGYNPSALTCGVGIYVEINKHIPQTRTSAWEPCIVAYGKCDGWSAVCAEVQAASILIDLVSSMISQTRSTGAPKPSAPISLSISK